MDCINAGPAALLSVCRQLNKEASTVFYSKSTFTFHGLGALRSFLDRLSPLSKESITRLAIIYRQYGNPERTEDSPWKTEHDRLWERLCWRVADECVSLTHLTLDLTLNKSPISFVPFDEAGEEGLGAQWIKPLWAFQDVGIERCWGRIRCSSKARSVLEVESWKMRKEILGDRWDDEAEAHRDPYGFRASGHDKQAMKRGMVLRLRADGTVEGV